jgi:hypothetical protein
MTFNRSIFTLFILISFKPLIAQEFDQLISYPQSNKAIVLVNSNMTNYFDFTDYIEPYLENFGIPYEVCDLKTSSLPTLQNYGIIIFGHPSVYQSNYPITALENAISSGVGLCSFDAHLFDYNSAFNNVATTKTLNVQQLKIPNVTHYITQKHLPDSYNPGNDVINLLSSWSLSQKSNLINGTVLVRAPNPNNSSDFVNLVEICSYGTGRVVKWNGTGWMSSLVLGQVYGMDDIVWRGIVWAARKPFIMLGLPPFVTMRVDDAYGAGGNNSSNFEWVGICNNYGWKPWLGTFNSQIPTSSIPTLANLINNGLATASPHAFLTYDFIYYNHNHDTDFDPVANCAIARDFYIQNDLKISKYFVPHYYELSTDCLPELVKMNCEFLAIHMLPDYGYGTADWLNCGPYRINDAENPYNDTHPIYYGDYVKLNGIDFFICLTEIRDDGGYEWYPMDLPGDNITTTSARGIRQLRRALNSMVLPSLFTHEYFFNTIALADWNTIMSNVTAGISSYNPVFTTTDYAVQYIRAKKNTNITNVVDNQTTIDIYYTASNDMDIKCHMYKESGGQITVTLVNLPQLNGSNVVSINY